MAGRKRRCLLKHPADLAGSTQCNRGKQIPVERNFRVENACSCCKVYTIERDFQIDASKRQAMKFLTIFGISLELEEDFHRETIGISPLEPRNNLRIERVQFSSHDELERCLQCTHRESQSKIDALLSSLS